MEDGLKICEWANQRAKVGALIEEQAGLLEQAGFAWDINKYACDEALDEAKKEI